MGKEQASTGSFNPPVKDLSQQIPAGKESLELIGY
jgi:hypothetical protein